MIYKQIRNLLLVLFAGILCAVALTVFMLYRYNPSGRYPIKNVMIDPKILPQLSYSSYDSGTRNTTRYLFDNIEFSFYNFTEKKWEKKTVSDVSYQKFYELVANERSIPDVKDQVVTLFNQQNTARLSLRLKAENFVKQTSTKGFQQIEFVNEGDYFRVELHDNSSQAQWAYYYYPHIYAKVINLINSGEDK